MVHSLDERFCLCLGCLLYCADKVQAYLSLYDEFWIKKHLLRTIIQKCQEHYAERLQGMWGSGKANLHFHLRNCAPKVYSDQAPHLSFANLYTRTIKM